MKKQWFLNLTLLIVALVLTFSPPPVLGAEAAACQEGGEIAEPKENQRCTKCSE